MEKLNLAYLTVGAAKSYSFYMIPKELIDNPVFDSADYGSKLLYSMMLNRASLSAINPNFIDSNGNVYIIYTVEQVMADLRCSNKTAIKMFSQLENIGLIERHKHGQGKPSTIYVKDFSTLKIHTCKKYTSGHEKNTRHDVNNLHGSNTDSSKNNFSKTDISIYPAQAENLEPTEAEPFDTIDNQKIDIPETTKETVAAQICLPDLISEQPDKEEKISELYDIVCDVLTADNADKIRVAKRQLPAVSVKQEFSKLGKDHIIYVLECLEKNAYNIKDNSKGYITTALYNSIHSIGHYKPHSQTAFADRDKDNIKSKGNYDIEAFFESRSKTPVLT